MVDHLRARRKRPSHRTAENRNEIAALHAIPSRLHPTNPAKRPNSASWVKIAEIGHNVSGAVSASESPLPANAAFGINAFSRKP
jgi:hypothetical protein